jgi:hypothetical protein
LTICSARRTRWPTCCARRSRDRAPPGIGGPKRVGRRGRRSDRCGARRNARRKVERLYSLVDPSWSAPGGTTWCG